MTYTEITDAIKDEMFHRGWSYNKLSVEAMIGSSTLYPVLNTNKTTSVGTILKILDALDLTLKVVPKDD